MKRKKAMFGWKKGVAVLTAACMIFVSGVVKAEAEKKSTNISLYARAAVLMDGRTGRILFEKNGTEQLPMASTTKIMTCILALENGNREDYIEISPYAAKMPKVKLFVKPGEYYQLEDLLYSLMLESHNDVAVAIAEHIGGSVEKFAAMMNQKARDIGCFDTCYITPNGLDAATKDGSRTHSTTARDLAAVMSYCLNESPMKEEFLKITGTSSHQFSNYIKERDTDGYRQGGRKFSVNNHNAFLHMMEGALSGKTGYTQKAGYCYVGSLERDGRMYVVALLAAGWPNHRSYRWSDTRELMNYGLDNYFYRDIFSLPVLAGMEVKEGIPESRKPFGTAYTGLQVETGGETSLQWLLKEEEKVEVKVDLIHTPEAPVAAGERVGTVSYHLNGEVIKEYPIIAKDTVQRVSLWWIAAYLYRLYCL